jgi:RNA polymerase sigma-70 factor (ECF subfamily)
MPIEERVSRLYLQHQSMLMEYIRALVHDPHDAEDVLQETGLIILSRAKVPAQDDVFPAWARGVARNTVLHFWRTRKRAKTIADSRLIDVFDQAFEEADPESELMIARRMALAECIKQVKGPALSILRMRYLQGLTCQRVAAVLRRTPVAVRVMLMRTRDALAECVEAKLAKEVA